MATPTAALEALDDDALATVRAQDGLVLDIESGNAISISEMLWRTDDSSGGACTSGGVANRKACTLLAPRLAGSGGNLAATLALDAGSNAGTPRIDLALDWQPLLLSTDRLTLRTPTIDYNGNTVGQLGIHSQGHFHLRNSGGPFNASGNLAQFNFTSQGDMVYRQGGPGSPELSFGNFELSFRSTTGAAGGQAPGPGRFGIDGQGLVASAPYMDMDLLFDLMYKPAPGNFDTTGRLPIIQFGWSGGLRNAELRLAAGGIGYGTYTAGGNTYFDLDGSHGGGARSEGLNLYAAWDFDSDFAWILGQAGGNRTQARFTHWRRMGNPSNPGPMLAMPLILDVLQNNVGPGGTGSNGLCFGNFTSGSPVQASCTAAGGSWVPSNVAAGNAAMAVLLRDAHVHAYNQQVEVVDPSSPNPTQLYDWSLLYTYGKLDADIFLYPQGRNPGVAVSTNNSGMKADITLAIQSPGYWDQANCTLSTSATQCLAGVGATAANAKAVRDALYTSGAGTRWATNTHFMVADTNVGGTGQQYGVGIVNADLLWTVRDMFFRVVNGDSGYPDMPGGLWMQTDTGATYRFRGLFGGGNLLDLSRPSGIALVDVNLSTNRFIFALHPRPAIAGDAPVGFSGLLDLTGAHLSLGEISQPASAYRIYDVAGRIGWKNGNVNLVSGQNTLDNLPLLSISNDLLFGNSANFGDGPGAPLVGKVGFGSENFGRIALPDGTWNSNVTLRIPGI